MAAKSCAATARRNQKRASCVCYTERTARLVACHDGSSVLAEESGVSTSTIYDRLKGLVTEQLGVDEEEITPEASFVDDLNADSLDLVELIMSLEEEFGLEISDEDAEKILTVGDAASYIEEHQS